MKKNNLRHIILAACLACVLILSSIGAVAAAPQSTFVITDFSMYPESLMPGDSGIVTVTIQNTGTTFVPVGQILIKDSDGIKSTVSQYQNPIGGVGAGDKFTLSVPITSTGKTGTFYPVLYVDFDGNSGNYLKYPFAVIVDYNSVAVSITSRPDVFEPNTTQTVSLSIGNLRMNAIEGVEISASGTGVTSKQNSAYLGTIASSKVVNGTLSITTSKETKEISIDVRYRNGANWHTESVTIPLESGISKTGAELIINNIEVKKSGTTYTITGDVNNAGLTTAKVLVVTTTGTNKTGAYPSYVVGSLDEDGLSEFEVTFKEPAGENVTLVFTYKDANGNVYTQTEEVSVTSGITETKTSDGASPVATVLIVIVILVILAGGFVAWKKGKLFARK
ncbi:MAG TPA: hypothetical protein O0W87_00270 [Methanocorpusculum sp.]|nr:hypothetical protein [Methanocorpusculum sp.]HJJ50631.1 hypothetical protein [Methanocorpusculum sp.]